MPNTDNVRIIRMTIGGIVIEEEKEEKRPQQQSEPRAHTRCRRFSSLCSLGNGGIDAASDGASERLERALKSIHRCPIGDRRKVDPDIARARTCTDPLHECIDIGDRRPVHDNIRLSRCMQGSGRGECGHGLSVRSYTH
jgi:hypothetical protein